MDRLCQQLADLERHYEKSRPLVHLVDNMVKLGSIYNRGSAPSTLDRLEYNQAMREKALFEQAAEQRRLAESAESLTREQVQQKVSQLKAMERSVAGETDAIRRERDSIQRALGSAHLHQDLARVHATLALNSEV